MAPEAVAAQSSSWFESFKQQYDLSKIPETSRNDFNYFLLHRAVVREYCLAIPAKKFNEGIGAGKSPKTEFIHHIGNSRMRIEGLETGGFTKWAYDQAHPEDHTTLTQMDRDALIQAFDDTTIQLYHLFTQPETESVKVKLPDGSTITGHELLIKASAHEIFHAGMGVEFNNYFKVPHPPAVMRAWGYPY